MQDAGVQPDGGSIAVELLLTNEIRCKDSTRTIIEQMLKKDNDLETTQIALQDAIR
jgi:hypothetical protein